MSRAKEDFRIVYASFIWLCKLAGATLSLSLALSPSLSLSLSLSLPLHPSLSMFPASLASLLLYYGVMGGLARSITRPGNVLPCVLRFE